jgi:hypothetical protein
MPTQDFFTVFLSEMPLLTPFWMHCGAGEISVLYTLHALIGTTM